MGISRLEIQGQIARAQDFTTIKHHEDSRGAVEQTALQSQTQKQEAVKLTRVQSADQTEGQHMNRHDAKEKGENEYAGDGGRHRPKQEKKEEDGKVLLKGISKRKVTDQV